MLRLSKHWVGLVFKSNIFHSEFMVEEHELQKEKIQEDYNDKYWDQRYTIVQHRIPSFLQKMADKILSTGKNKKTNV